MYYLGFLKDNTTDVVIFKAIVKPKKNDYSYFTKVMGPYQSEGNARKGLRALKQAYGEYGYRENPSKESRASYRKIGGVGCQKGHVHSGRRVRSENPLKSSVEKAVRLTKRLIRGYEAFRQENPGKSYHDQKFLRFMGELEKYTIGSSPYIATLAKAYEHLESAKDSESEKVR